MARSDYESIIAPKPVIRKIEEFQKENGYPSKSQALSAIVAELDKEETVRTQLALLINELKALLEKIRAGVNVNEALQSLLNLIVATLKELPLVPNQSGVI